MAEPQTVLEILEAVNFRFTPISNIYLSGTHTSSDSDH